jgi:predicted ABC-type ATPase
MNTFTFIVGPVAAGKTTFMENKLYNINKNESNFFDHDKAKLMIQLYANDKSKFNDINLGNALKNAINDSIHNHKDFMMQIHFTTDQLSQINSYLHEYKDKFYFNAHFIAVSEVEILRERANKRELLGGHSSEGKSIDKSFNQSFKNFITYLPKFKKATIWDNTKEFGFNSMEQQLVFENGNLIFKNPNLTDYSQTLLNRVDNNIQNEVLHKKSQTIQLSKKPKLGRKL